ncbi:MAG: hypothetical protein AB1Z22_09145 [Synechococcaceae cyanobacterium]
MGGLPLEPGSPAAQRLLREGYAAIFEQELRSWNRSSLWPQGLSDDLFRADGEL